MLYNTNCDRRASKVVHKRNTKLVYAIEWIQHMLNMPYYNEPKYSKWEIVNTNSGKQVQNPTSTDRSCTQEQRLHSCKSAMDLIWMMYTYDRRIFEMKLINNTSWTIMLLVIALQQSPVWRTSLDRKYVQSEGLFVMFFVCILCGNLEYARCGEQVWTGSVFKVKVYLLCCSLCIIFLCGNLEYARCGEQVQTGSVFKVKVCL